MLIGETVIRHWGYCVLIGEAVIQHCLVLCVLIGESVIRHEGSLSTVNCRFGELLLWGIQIEDSHLALVGLQLHRLRSMMYWVVQLIMICNGKTPGIGEGAWSRITGPSVVKPPICLRAS